MYICGLVQRWDLCRNVVIIVSLEVAVCDAVRLFD